MLMVWGFYCSYAQCKAVYSIDYSESDTAVLESLAREGACLHCGADLKIMLAPPKEGIQFERFQAQEYWKRLYGLGSADERVLGCTKIKYLLTNQRVMDAALEESQTGRCVIRSLTMESGCVLHFAVGFGEAVIYKVTEERQCQEE